MFKKKPPEPDRMGRQRDPQRASAPRNAAVFSYHANRSSRLGGTGRNDPHEAPAVAARRSSQLRMFERIPTIAGLAVLLVVIMGNLIMAGAPRVVVADGAAVAVPLRDIGDYRLAATALTAASPLNKFKLTADTRKIEDGLRAQFPELVDVHVSIPFIGASSTVHVTPGTPRLLLNDGSALYAIDTSGKALVAANRVPHLEKLDLPVVVDQSGLVVSAGKPALSSSNVTFITEVIGQLKAKGLTITNTTLPAGTSEMDVHISGVGYVVKFNLQGDGRAQAGAFLAVKDQLARDHKTPGSYVDVRVEERAYYK